MFDSPNMAPTRTHAVEGLFFTIQLHRGGDDSGYGVDVKVLPVSVTGSGLEERIADLSIHTLIRVCCMDLVHREAGGLLLQEGLKKKDQKKVT